MTIKNVASAIAILVTVMVVTALAQDCSITPIKAHNIVRSAGNNVWTYAQTYATGNGAAYWYARVITTETLNSSTWNGRQSTENDGGYGGTATNQWHDTINASYGLGLYNTNSTHTLTPNSTYCPGYSPTSSTSSDSLTASLPLINTQGINGVWWLGGGNDGANLLYNQMSLQYQDSSSPQPPGPPNWSITQGNQAEATLNCSSCTTNLMTSQRGGTSCADLVTVSMQIGGLAATPVKLGVNQPSYFLPQTPTNYHAYSGSDGYETDIPYLIYPVCGGPFQSIAVNENFASYQPDYTGSGFDWQPITEQSAGAISGFSNIGFYDRIRVVDVVGCGFKPCVPKPTNYVGGLVNVDHVTQTWYTGSTTHYSGVLTHTDTLARFTDHAAHQ